MLSSKKLMLVEVQRDLVLEDQENEPSESVLNLQLEKEEELFFAVKVRKRGVKLKGEQVVLVFFWRQLGVRTCFLKHQVFSLLSDWSHHFFQMLKWAWVLSLSSLALEPLRKLENSSSVFYSLKNAEKKHPQKMFFHDKMKKNR